MSLANQLYPTNISNGTNEAYLVAFDAGYVNADSTLGRTYNLDLGVTYAQLAANSTTALTAFEGAGQNLSTDANWVTFIGVGATSQISYAIYAAGDTVTLANNGIFVTGTTALTVPLTGSWATSISAINTQASEINYGMLTGVSSVIKNTDLAASGQANAGIPFNQFWGAFAYDPTAAYGSSDNLYFGGAHLGSVMSHGHPTSVQLIAATDIAQVGAFTLSGNTLLYAPVGGTPPNVPPTFTAFNSTIAASLQKAQVTTTFADLLAKSDAADTDGTVTAFVVKSVTAGALLIGATAATATAFDATTNATIDATHSAFWTGYGFGNLNAFTVVAQDNSQAKSSTPIQAQYAVTLALNGDISDNFLTGSNGNDIIHGNAGNDTLRGGLGDDTMIGGTGNDTYYVGSTGDKVFETTVATDLDTVISSISYTLTTNVENLVLSGTDALNGTGNSSDNVLTGNYLDNVLIGNNGNDILLGGAGNDTLKGGTGNDTLMGGTGNDTYFVDSAGDKVIETTLATDIDTVNSSITYTLGANVENLMLVGTSALNGIGNSLDNLITGNIASNSLMGDAGNDTINGGGGNDTITGGAGNDVLDGNSGNDVLVGGLGNDTLTGGVGVDQFLYNVGALSSNKDLITDFTSGTDQLIFKASALPALGAAGQLAVNDQRFYSSAVGAHDASTRLIYNSSTGELSFDADGTGVKASVVIEVLGTTTHPVLSATDIYIV